MGEAPTGSGAAPRRGAGQSPAKIFVAILGLKLLIFNANSVLSYIFVSILKSHSNRLYYDGRRASVPRPSHSISER